MKFELREFKPERVVDYFALEVCEFVDVSRFDVFAMIIKIGINAARFIGNMKGDLVGVIGGWLHRDDLESQGKATPKVGCQLCDGDVLIHTIIFY